MEECQFEDLGFKGYPYTWNTKRLGEANTKIQLDRVVAMKEQREMFQLSSVLHWLLMHRITSPLFFIHRNLRSIEYREEKGLSLRKHGCFRRNMRIFFEKHGL